MTGAAKKEEETMSTELQAKVEVRNFILAVGHQGWHGTDADEPNGASYLFDVIRKQCCDAPEFLSEVRAAIAAEKKAIPDNEIKYGGDVVKALDALVETLADADPKQIERKPSVPPPEPLEALAQHLGSLARELTQELKTAPVRFAESLVTELTKAGLLKTVGEPRPGDTTGGSKRGP
jgi:hypothetical protein